IRKWIPNSINPLFGLKVSVPKRSTINKFYTPTEIQNHVDLLLKHSTTELALMYILTVLGGLRPAELRGLLWEKILIEENLMVIDHNLTRTKKSGDIYKSTKNQVERTTTLIPLAINRFEAHKEDEMLKRQRLKIRTNIEKLPVFTNDYGQPVIEAYFRDNWKRFCQRHNI